MCSFLFISNYIQVSFNLLREIQYGIIMLPPSRKESKLSFKIIISKTVYLKVENKLIQFKPD
jgi:hypothetical protein